MKTFMIMSANALLFCSGMTCAAAAPAVEAATPSTGFEVLRPTDSMMSCDQMMTEINTLSAEVRDRQRTRLLNTEKASRNGAGGSGIGAGMAMNAASAGGATAGNRLASMLPFVGPLLLMGEAARQESKAQEAQRTAAEAQAEAMAPLPEQERLHHVMEMYRQKQC